MILALTFNVFVPHLWCSSPQTQLFSIAVLQQTHPSDSRIVSVRGSLTHLGRDVFVQDSTGAIRLEGDNLGDRIALGDEIEVTGILKAEKGPVLVVRTLRRLWGNSTPLPLALDPDRAADGNANGLLVQLHSKLIRKESLANGELRLTLQGGSQTYAAALLAQPRDLKVAMDWPVNGELLLTGVLQQNPQSPGLADAPFELLMRSADDVEVVRAAPWLNLEHLIWIGIACGMVVLFALLQIQRMRGLRMRSVMEERGRIARDIHDTLAQGFAGITLQLESAELLMDRDSKSAREALRLALQMVRRSRSDSHAAIRVLRSLSRNEPLNSLLRLGTEDCVGKALQVVHSTEGIPFEMPYEVTHQLFYIGMEAFANVVQHSGATRARLITRFEKSSVTVCVEDDGCGFDPEVAEKHPQDGHFGLIGMRERAAAIGAELQIRTALRCGTQLQVTAPRTRSPRESKRKGS